MHFQSTRSFPCTRTLTVHIANKMKQCFNKLSNSIVVSNNNKLLNPCTVHYKLVINFIPEKNISIMCVLFSSFFPSYLFSQDIFQNPSQAVWWWKLSLIDIISQFSISQNVLITGSFMHPKNQYFQSLYRFFIATTSRYLFPTS